MSVYDSKIEVDADKETTPLIGDEGKQAAKVEWWERPKEAVSTTSHLNISADPPKEGEIASLNSGAHQHKKLGEILATAISGNDITSSVLYVSGYAGLVCGVYSPIALILVALLLALYRPIYTEVVTALPMNGGTYNALLNTTTKKVASVAGALSILSYVATAVVSATSAMEYLQKLYEKLPVNYCVIALLAFFAILNLIGITESAVVAVVLFAIHCITLMILIVFSFINFFKSDFSLIKDNWHEGTEQQHNWAYAIFLGYGASMLGITGFETSANFVEQQKPGVFPKTLRNMWIAVSFFNPVISFLSIAILPIAQVRNPNNTGALLSLLALKAGGKWLNYLVSIDAVLVLAGAVLTGYVGVTGLARRLALDRILPQFLLQENRLTKTNHWIIIIFFLLCSSLYLIVHGQVDALSGVYTAAFLCVMALFAIGNMLLKYKRAKLPKEVNTPWIVVIIAFCGVIVAFISNLIGNPTVIKPFGIYFGATMAFFILMFLRISLLKILLFFTKKVIKNQRLHRFIERQIQKLNGAKIVFFTREDDIAVLNKAILYIRDNEQTNWIVIVHVYQVQENIPPKLEQNVRILDEAYPKFRIDLVTVRGEFGPVLVDQIATKLDVPKNFMFITTPSERFAHKVSDLGGVRLVTH